MPLKNPLLLKLLMKNLFKNCLNPSIAMRWRIILKYLFFKKIFHLPNNFISYCQTISLHTANLFINAFHLSSLRFSFAGHNLLLFLLTSKEKLSDCVGHKYDSYVIFEVKLCLFNVKVCLFICQVYMGMKPPSFGPGAAYVNIQKRVDNHS